MENTEILTGTIRPIVCFKEAWAMIKDQYWLILGVTIVGMLVGGAVPIVLIGPMMAGIYLVILKKLDGEPIEFGTLFKGFDYFLPTLILTLVIMVPMIFVLIFMYAPMIVMVIAGDRMSQDELIAFLIGTAIVEFFVVIIMAMIHTLVIFSFPLIVDKNYSAIASIKQSAIAVWRNLGGIAGLFGVGFLVAIAGYLLFCIGIYLVLPVIIAANAVAYRKIFPAGPRTFATPPPPTAYQGL